MVILINANYKGYNNINNNTFNIGYKNASDGGRGLYINKYGDEKLQTIYLGSGGYWKVKNKYYNGGGIIYIIGNILVNFGKITSGGELWSSGGSIFMLLN